MVQPLDALLYSIWAGRGGAEMLLGGKKGGGRCCKSHSLRWDRLFKRVLFDGYHIFIICLFVYLFARKIRKVR